MDALDRISVTAQDLLDRVDAALSVGAPAGHRVWPLLRWVRVLPGSAVRALVALRPIEAPSSRTQGLVRRVEEAAAPVSRPAIWEGVAGEAFETHRRELQAGILGREESVASRLRDLASYLDDLDAWVAESRVSLALQLATVLRSQEALTLVAGEDAALIGLAAAEVGARVLGKVEEILRAGEELESGWAQRLVPLPRERWQQPDLAGPAAPTTLRLDL